MPDLSDARALRELLARCGVTLKQSLGQNFLINPSVCPRMAQAACGGSAGVLEIGPGAGVLTAALAERAEKVVAVEIDRRLEPVLAETLRGRPNVELVFGDVMQLDLAALLRERFGGRPVAVCANLPYYITSPILMRLLEERLPLTSITVMVQKEAAQRLCAEPGTRACGAVTAAVRYYAEPELLFSVSRGSFLPPPKVDSAVIRLNVRREPPVAVRDETRFFALIRAAFAQRRKTLPNAVSAGLGLPKQTVCAALDAAGLKQDLRAESLTLAEFAALCAALDGVPAPTQIDRP